MEGEPAQLRAHLLLGFLTLAAPSSESRSATEVAMCAHAGMSCVGNRTVPRNVCLEGDHCRQDLVCNLRV